MSTTQTSYVEYWKIDDKRLGFPMPIDQTMELDEKKSQAALIQRTTMKKKWATFLEANKGKEDQVLKKENSKFKKLCRKGVPMHLRPLIWFKTSGAAQKKAAANNIMLEIDPKKPFIPVSQDTVQAIEMDIVRTLPNHPFFSTQEARDSMRRILLTYAQRNPTVGYSQNLPNILTIPMLLLTEDDAFWLLATIMEEVLPTNFGNSTFQGLRVDQKVLGVLIHERLPKLYAHFTKHNMDISFFTTPWLLTLFVDIFPIETTLRVWDAFLCEGSKILFRVMLAFLKLHEDQILKLETIPELKTFLTNARVHLFDADELITTCMSFWNLSRKQINALRKKFTEEVVKEDSA